MRSFILIKNKSRPIICFRSLFNALPACLESMYISGFEFLSNLFAFSCLVDSHPIHCASFFEIGKIDSRKKPVPLVLLECSHERMIAALPYWEDFDRCKGQLPGAIVYFRPIHSKTYLLHLELSSLFLSSSFSINFANFHGYNGPTSI